ncbi:peptidase domain-containing ABC transporter [Paraburkholderia caledonica]|uniref:ATP-binding cassette subfamily B protein RaxB n=1 Tax=Paraburkholderia caledonica TaxID=134536 RepID=A0AB73ING4_9BURK|nr:ATP-binding cassette subfamily B protein RaxB [Paraburkholderia caledonica]
MFIDAAEIESLLWKSLKFSSQNRLPLILQTEAAECGLASMAMLAGFYGYRTDLITLRRNFPLSLRGINVEQLVKLGDQLGLAGRAIRVDIGDLADISLPCILHWDFNHFVVLRTVSKHGVVVHDPKLGVKKYDYDKFSEHFTGIAIEFQPTLQFRTGDTTQSVTLSGLLGGLSDVKRSLLHTLSLSIFLQLFVLVNPLFLRWAIDSANRRFDHSAIFFAAAAFAALTICQVSTNALRAWIVLHASMRLRLRWTTDLVSHLLSLPMSFFERRFIGDTMSRFSSVTAVQQTVATDVTGALLDTMVVIATVIAMAYVFPWIAFAPACCGVLLASIRFFSFRYERANSKQQLVLASKQNGSLLESLRGIQTVKSLGLLSIRRANYLNSFVDLLNNNIEGQRRAILIGLLSNLILGTEYVVTVALCALLLWDHRSNAGPVFAFLAYRNQFVARINSLTGEICNLGMLNVHAERLADILLQERETEHVKNQASYTFSSAPSVVLENVSFRHSPTDPWVFRGINLAIGPGKTVAIVGPSGCGKTSLLKIISGLYTPTEGRVLINGRDLTGLNMNTYRDSIGVVLQDDRLFSGTIADNICGFDIEPDHERIELAAQQAAIHEDILRMPMAYNTLIGEMGSVLSGGQKQRIYVARAIYRKPLLLLLDEATSHLDIDNERRLNGALGRLNVTTIVIAHRTETISACEQVVKFEEL